MSKKKVKGWIYIFTNQSLNGLIKIGFSTKDPFLRVKEQDQSGLPYAHKLVYEALVYGAQQIEQAVHISLANKKENKEWFRCTIDDGINKIREITENKILFEKTYEYLEISIQEQLQKNLKIESTIQTPTSPDIDKAEKTHRQIYYGSSGYAHRDRSETITPMGFYVKQINPVCTKCGMSYSVTLNRYEYASICPHCRNLNSANVSW